jgi:hypothetical protein
MAKTQKRRPRGRPSKYRGKDRTRVISLTMSDGGHGALARLVARDPEHKTRAEIIEEAIREKAART